ncbi:MAG: Fic family protein [Myxococcota bacterium]
MVNKAKVIKDARTALAKSLAGWSGLYFIGEGSNGDAWLVICADKKNPAKKLKSAVAALDQDVKFSKKAAGQVIEGKTLFPAKVAGVGQHNPAVASVLFKKLKKDKDWKKLASKLAFGGPNDTEAVAADAQMSEKEIVQLLQDAARLDDEESKELLISISRIDGILDRMPNLKAIVDEFSTDILDDAFDDIMNDDEPYNGINEMSKEDRQVLARKVVARMDPFKIDYEDVTWLTDMHKQLAVDLPEAEQGVFRTGPMSHKLNVIHLAPIDAVIKKKDKAVADELAKVFMEDPDELFLPRKRRSKDKDPYAALSKEAALFLKAVDNHVDPDNANSNKVIRKAVKYTRIKNASKHIIMLHAALHNPYFRDKIELALLKLVPDLLSKTQNEQVAALTEAFPNAQDATNLIKKVSLERVAESKKKYIESLKSGTLVKALKSGELGVQLTPFKDYHDEVYLKTERELTPKVIQEMMSALSMEVGEIVESADQLERPLNREKVLPVALKAAEQHCKLTAIHPFPDGNGRSSRAVLDLILKAHNIPAITLLSNDAYNKAADTGVMKKDYGPLAEIIVKAVLDAE